VEQISPIALERYRRQRQKRNLYTMAITWDKATENPVKKVRLARENNDKMRILSSDEEVRLLDQCGAKLKPLVIAALNTGFRSSELLSLTWADVDFSSGYITVRAAYAKNGESRSVPVNKVLTETSQAIRISNSLIEDVTFHLLRHAFASPLVMAGLIYQR
jgi:integrase